MAAKKKTTKKSKRMTGKFPSVKGFVTRCERIARRAGVSIDCTKLYSKAKTKKKGGLKIAKKSRKK